MLVAVLIINGLTSGLIYGLIGLGFSLIFRGAGMVNFSLGELVMLGSLVGYTALTKGDSAFWQAMMVALVSVGLVALLTERIVFRELRRRGAPLLNAVIASIGLLTTINQGALLVWGAEPLSYPSRLSSGAMWVGPVVIPHQIAWIAGLSIVLMLILQLFLRRTRLGLSLRAVADDRTMSEFLGVDSDKAIALTFLLGGALAGASGVLLGPLYYASYNLGLIGIKGFAAAVLGGLGSLPGAVLGGVVLGITESVASVYVSSSYRDVVAYALLIILLLVRPQGLLGVVERADT